MNLSSNSRPFTNVVRSLACAALGAAASGNAIQAAGLPATLLKDQAVLANDRVTGHGYGSAVAISGDVAVVGLDGGDPYAEVQVFERNGSDWTRVGRLTDSRAATFDGFGHSVSVDHETIAVGDSFQNNAAYAFVRGGGPVWNAWNITDATTTGIGPSYRVTLSAQQHSDLRANGWHFSVHARMVRDLDSSVCMYFSYGNATNRYLFFLHFTPNGDLFAQLPGAAQSQYVLTTNGVAADDYHLHELDFDPATGMATYLYDGSPVTTWGGQALTNAEGVRWGAGSTPGTGSINVHQVTFASKTGTLLASYDAGSPGNAPGSLNPLEQGWANLSSPGVAYTSQEPLTPDIGTVWAEQARVTAADGSANNEFGNSIDISGDTMVVGAPYQTGGGAAYVFIRQGSNWTQQAKLVPSPAVSNGTFGDTVAIDGDTIVVGSTPYNQIGRAYVFGRNGADWTQQASFTAPAPDGNINDDFGNSVDVKGDTVVIGAPYAAPLLHQGAAYVSTRTGTTWSTLTPLVATPAADTGFGYSVALDGDTLLVGSDILKSYVFVRHDSVWNQTGSRTYPNQCEGGGVTAAIDGETLLAGVPSGCSGLQPGLVYVQVPDYTDVAGVTDYVNQMLYYPAAVAGSLPPDQAAFRYKKLLYDQDSQGIRARFENMDSLYGPDERLRADEAEQVVLRGLTVHPDDASLGNLWLDILYDRTVAESILGGNVLTNAAIAHFGGTIAPPAPSGGFIIDNEIPLYREWLATNRFSLQKYFDGLGQSLVVDGSPPANVRWASRVVGSSSEYAMGDASWSSLQVVGQPDTYPNYGDIPTSWASTNPDSESEFLILGYDNPAKIDSVSIYETYNPGAVDKVSVQNPYTGDWVVVWTGTAAPAGTDARIFPVNFPLTEFPVSEVRIDIDSPAVPGWNEIDAVSISGPGATPVQSDGAFGYHLFQTLVPGRALMAATYTNSSGADVPVTANATLFSGYKDLVLLFDRLSEQGAQAEKLARLLIGRNGPVDRIEANALITDSERFLFLQGTLLKNTFNNLPPAGDPSGLAESIAAWGTNLRALQGLQQLLVSGNNVLGYADDFMMYVQQFSGQTDYFDSFDALRVRLDPLGGSNPLQSAVAAYEQALSTYKDYRGYEDELAAQFDNSSITYRDRLRDIVGVFPDDPTYGDDPTAHPGSEINQQYQSIQLAKLQIERNQTEIDNVNAKMAIELNKATGISNVMVNFGNQQAQLTREIAHWNAAQAGANALASGISIDKIATGQVFALAANAALQTTAEEMKGQAEAQKEQLAALEQATITGIEAAATVKTLALDLKTLAVDSQSASITLQQEINRLVALYREKSQLESKIAQQNSSIAQRYFADPIHRLASDADMESADLAFDEARKWLYFMERALEYKWNTPFQNFSYQGRTWSGQTLFKLRNAAELQSFYEAMDNYDSQIQLPKDDYFDWFSVRDDFMGYKPTNSLGQAMTYADPVSGAAVDALTAFRSRLRQLQDSQGNIVLDFSTVKEIPGGTFFRGPRFNAQGQVLSKGLFLDKIRWIQINLPGHHTLNRSQLTGELRYGGTSFIRNFDVGTFDPLRPDLLRNELATYSTRYWFFHAPSSTWRFTDALSSPVTMQLSSDPRVPPSVQQLDAFKERSVATSDWTLTIPTVDAGQPVMNIDELDDVELYFYHYAVARQ